MKATIFAQKKTTKEGKKFFTYLATLVNKEGKEVKVTAKFKEECGQPKPEQCPCIIEFEKKDANIKEQEVKYTDEVGEEQTAIRKTLWIANWTLSDEEFVDHSMDDFE